MKTIYLFCAQGVSTGIFVKRMMSYVKETNYQYEVYAYPVSRAEELLQKADYILIGPQISYELDRVKKLFPSIPVNVIDPLTYGNMDGTAVVERIVSEIGK